MAAVAGAASITTLTTSPNITRGQGQGDDEGMMSAMMEGDKNWATLGLSVLIVATMGGNVLVCIAVSWERRLQNMTNYFLMSLAIADLMVGTLVMPLALVVELYGYFPLSEEVCVLWASLDVLMCTASIWHMCTLSTDRYLTLKYPMKYGRNKTKLMVAIKIAFVWLVSIGISSPIVVMGFLDYSTVYVDGRCVPTSKSFVIYGSILAYFVPLLINIITYALTMRILFHNQKMLLGHLSGAGSGRLARIRRLHAGGSGETHHHHRARDLHLRSIDTQSLPSAPRRLLPVANGNCAGTVTMQRSRLPLQSASDEYSDTFVTTSYAERVDVTTVHSRYRHEMGHFASSSLEEESNVVIEDAVRAAVSKRGAGPPLTTRLVGRQSSDEISEDGERTFDDSSDHVSCSTMSRGQYSAAIAAAALLAASRNRERTSHVSPCPTPKTAQHHIVHPPPETPIVCLTAESEEPSVTIAQSDAPPSPTFVYIDNADDDTYIQHPVHDISNSKPHADNNEANEGEPAEEDTFLERATLPSQLSDQLKDSDNEKSQHTTTQQTQADRDQLAVAHLITDTQLHSKPSQLENCNGHNGDNHTDMANHCHKTVGATNGKCNGGPTAVVATTASEEESMRASLRRYRTAWKCLQRHLSVRTAHRGAGNTSIGRANREQATPTGKEHKTFTSSLAGSRSGALGGARRGHHGNSRQHQRILQGSAAKNERKALKVLGIIFTVFVVFWTPFFALNIVSVICESCVASLSAPALTAIVWLGYVSSLANPVIYTMFNVHFRLAFKNILTCRYRARCFGTFDPTTDSAALHLTNWATAGNRSTNHAGGSGDNIINV